MQQYDLFSFGNISIDYIKTPTFQQEMTGGAVLYAVWVAHQLGYKVGICTKIAAKDKFRLKEFPISAKDITAKDSKETTSIFNDYLTADMERRVCTNKGQADPFQISDFPQFKAKAIQYSGLVVGEINLEIIQFLAKKGPLAIDAQGLTRKVMPNKQMDFQKQCHRFSTSKRMPLKQNFLPV
jgi:sugar/nucleoside kinase (ribokinase family)